MKHFFTGLFLLPLLALAQLNGVDAFAPNQVLRVDLTFPQVSFWDSLVANYPTETSMMAHMQITDLNGVHTKDSIAIRLKGNSSYGHPGNKKSFRIDLNQYVLGRDYDGLKKLNFNNCFKDPSFMREKLFFDLCQTLSIPAPRVAYADVYMNGTLWGFYTMVEQVDDQFLDNTIMEDQGNLFKAGDNTDGQSGADLVYYGNTQTAYSSRYELKTNETLNDWTDLIALINFINNSSSATFEADFNTNMNQYKYIRSLVLDNLFSNLDSYTNSARNYYLYHNMVTMQWEWIKWDANEAFGMYGGPGTGNLEQLAPNYVAANRPLISKLFANTTLYNLYLDEMCTIMQGYFNPAYMNARADELKTLIQSHVEADVNKMYTTAQFNTSIESNVTVSGGMGNQTVFGIKSFVANKSNYLSGLLGCVIGVPENEMEDVKVYPNPFSSSIQIPQNCKVLSLKDASGREVAYKSTPSDMGQSLEIDPENGVYFLTIDFEGRIRTIKMVQSN